MTAPLKVWPEEDLAVAEHIRLAVAVDIAERERLLPFGRMKGRDPDRSLAQPADHDLAALAHRQLHLAVPIPVARRRIQDRCAELELLQRLSGGVQHLNPAARGNHEQIIRVGGDHLPGQKPRLTRRNFHGA